MLSHALKQEGTHTQIPCHNGNSINLLKLIPKSNHTINLKKIESCKKKTQVPSPHTSSWQHPGVGLVGKGWGDEEDSLSSCRGTGKAAEAVLQRAGPAQQCKAGSGAGKGGTGVVGPAQHLPLHRAVWLAAALGNLPGSSPAGTLAGYRAGLAGASVESGAQSPSWGPAGWCQPLSQAAVGGHGRQMAWCPGWCWRVHGPGLTGLTFTGLGPQGAGAVSPPLSRQGLVCRRWGQEHIHLPVSCNPLQLHSRDAPMSHTLFE